MSTSTETGGTTIAACLAAGRQGFTMGNRVSVPFRAELISILIGKQHSMLASPDLLTDFSPSQRHVVVVEKPSRMDLYFQGHDSLQQELGHWRGTLIITCCEAGNDIFDPASHLRLVLTFRDDDPRVKIERQAEA